MFLDRRTAPAFSVLVLGLLASWAALAAAQPERNPLGNGLPADPSRFRPGEVDASAVTQVETFAAYPVAWLGEESAGFKLTKMFRADANGQDAVYLIYGECVPRPGAQEPSCVPPLEIVTNAPGTVPGPEDQRLVNAGELASVRGAAARALSGSPFIWTETVTITIHANAPLVEEVLANLRSANHEELRFDEVSPGDSLSGFGR